MTESNCNFKSAISAGVAAHINGDYELALDERFRALSLADNRIERGTAARDISAAYDRLGDKKIAGAAINNQVLANAYAEYAYRKHSIAMEAEGLSNKEKAFTEFEEKAAREFTASAMYLAISDARIGNIQEALRIIEEGWKVSSTLYIRHRSEGTENPSYHQYDVNIISRYVAIKAIVENRLNHVAQPRTAQNLLEIKQKRRETRKLGLSAFKLARKSESPNEVLGANNSLAQKEIRNAQLKASVRALAAFAIALIEASPINTKSEPLADTILQKVVL